MLKELIQKNRSYRRFWNNYVIEYKILERLIDLSRICSSGRNLQPLKYYISCKEETNALIFETLSWAGYLSDWDGPEVEERPTAYIIVLTDKKLTTGTPSIDIGIASQNILLGAVEEGLGGCIIGAIKRKELKEYLNISDSLDIAVVIAIGKPKEEVRIVSLPQNGDIKYYRDESGIHYVPKRSLEDIIINKNL